MKTCPAFIVRHPQGHITDIVQAGAADRRNFRMVFGIARGWAAEQGGTVEIVRRTADGKACD